ncbi:MAG: EI24 domain-containing protein [Bacteriovoracaceae bacterium]
MKTFREALHLITRDPVNLFLAIVPTAIALSLYIFLMVYVFRRADYFGLLVADYLPSKDSAGIVGIILTGILILFVFLLMMWTFVIVVGLIASPFNSMLSSRIETILAGKPVGEDRKKTLSEMASSLGKTFKNELKKLVFIALVAGIAFVLNLFPLFYPVGVFLVAVLFAVQFVDYSWSRHDMSFGECVGDVFRNIIPYSVSGFLFLLAVSIPIINAFIPAFATSYFTVLWLKRQKKIPA